MQTNITHTNATHTRRLLLFRALRPDRLTSAMTKFVATMLGDKFVNSQPYDLERSFAVSLCEREHPYLLNRVSVNSQPYDLEVLCAPLH